MGLNLKLAVHPNPIPNFSYVLSSLISYLEMFLLTTLIQGVFSPFLIRHVFIDITILNFLLCIYGNMVMYQVLRIVNIKLP